MFQNFHRQRDTSKAAEVRLQKVGQHKLDSDGYMNLHSQLVSSNNGISYLKKLYNVAKNLF